MNHAITIGGLLLGLSALVGLIMVLLGAVMMLAGGMSDAPTAGDNASRQGCFVFLLGCAFLVGGIWGLIV